MQLQYKFLWQSVVVFGTELHGTSPATVCQSPKFLPDVINCQFREFAVALSGPVHFLSLNQQSGNYCPIICAIQLLTPNNLGGTWRCICSPDIRSISTLEVLRKCNLQIDIYFTYLLLNQLAANVDNNWPWLTQSAYIYSQNLKADCNHSTMLSTTQSTGWKPQWLHCKGKGKSKRGFV